MYNGITWNTKIDVNGNNRMFTIIVCTIVIITLCVYIVCYYFAFQVFTAGNALMIQQYDYFYFAMQSKVSLKSSSIVVT